jgi:hypothetical protein
MQSFSFDTPRARTGGGSAAEPSQGGDDRRASAPPADPELREVVGLLRRVLDRLPE